jgi:hypothetical protein
LIEDLKILKIKNVWNTGKRIRKFSSDDVALGATYSVKLEIAEIIVLYIKNNKGFDFNYDNGFDINEFISAFLIKSNNFLKINYKEKISCYGQ